MRPLWILYAGGVLWVRNVGWNVLLNLWVLWEKEISFVKEKTPHAPHKQPNRGNLTYHAPPCGGGVGGGATILCARNVRQKAQWTLCALWEKNLLSVREKTSHDLFVYHLIARVLSIPHRKTQKNRTHRVQYKWYPPIRRLYIIRCYCLRVHSVYCSRNCFSFFSIKLKSLIAFFLSFARSYFSLHFLIP